MNKKILIIVGVVALLVIIGAVVAVVLLGGTPKEKPVVYYEYVFAEEYSNLADQDSKKIIKYQVTIEYTVEDMGAVFDINKP